MNARWEGLIPLASPNEPIAQHKILAITEPRHMAFLKRRDTDTLVTTIEIVERASTGERIVVRGLSCKKKRVPRVGEQMDPANFRKRFQVTIR
jgi:hypothetical protein